MEYPERKCCGKIPDIESYWPALYNHERQCFGIRCPVCGLETRITAFSREEAIHLWEEEEVC